MTHVALEATGVYWKPVYYVLENDFELLLVNPAHFKQAPGRKTDVADCAWLAQLLQYGLLRASFVPPAPIRELRDLTRYRKSLTESAAAPPIDCTRCCRMPASSSPASQPTRWEYPVARC